MVQVQVDKKTIFMVVLTLFFFAGCASKDNVTSLKKYDDNITKDQLLNAAKKVFKYSDSSKFIIDSYYNELKVKKTDMDFGFLTATVREDSFDFKVFKDQNDSLTATLSISRQFGIDNNDSIEYIDPEVYEYGLFWDRVDYFLGIKDEYARCNYPISKGLICDLGVLENNKPIKKDVE
ncbi:MAG: hypothetical protein U9Q04_04235 [Campylobacterota bacterium]|nr:hypothetical protein [Campylobacterota bacterium]